MKQILLLEDDAVLSAGITSALDQDDYTFTQCFTISDARKALKETAYDLLLLDVNLPDGSGAQLCEEIRASSQVPIILLTVKNLETDIVYGLNAGADDYITKPFTLMVLRARVNALLRRSSHGLADGENLYKEPPFFFDFPSMIFKKNGQEFTLSKTEQRLLKLLTANKNRTLTRDTLIDRIWSGDGAFIDENALSVTIKRLRSKIEDDPSSPNYIKTVYGIGYIWGKKK